MNDSIVNRLLVCTLMLFLVAICWGMKEHGDKLALKLQTSEQQLQSTKQNLEIVRKEKEAYETAIDSAIKERGRIGDEYKERSKGTNEALHKNQSWSATLVPDDVLNELRPQARH